MIIISSINHCYISLPNGCSAIVNFEGNVILNSSLVLIYVLYVLNLAWNLLFIFQLLGYHPNYFVKIIFKGLCLIHDDTTRKKIRVSRLNDGVYHFLPEQANHKIRVSLELLHKYFGHLYFSTMGQIKFIPLNSPSLSSCNVCSQTKQILCLLFPRVI